MSKDQVLGAVVMVCCILGIIIYGWLVFFSGFWQLIIKITAFVAVAGVLGVLAWIGYTLATTPPPKPIEEIERELEEELKKTEQSTQTENTGEDRT